MALLFLLAALHVFFLKGSMSPDGDRLWPRETPPSQLCGDSLAGSQTRQSSNYWEITVTMI